MSRVRQSLALSTLLACLLTLVPAVLSAQPGEPVITVDGVSFDTWEDYYRSGFLETGRRCGTPERLERQLLFPDLNPTSRAAGEGVVGVPADCAVNATNPDSVYAPTATRWVIPVVVHIIMNDACTAGSMTDANVQGQIDILNEDFQAILGSNGANGNNHEIHFELATTDPGGMPTTGITRTCNTTFYNDGGSYWNTLAWDPNTYMNIYSNTAGGNLGYVPFLPADGGGSLVGGNNDRVVVLDTTFGPDAPFAPFDLGRTGTHEVGHYLGLEHTFSGGCSAATAPGCYTSGDLICDTNSESSPYFGCGAPRSTCGTVDPRDNYMDYSDDICMEQFTV